MMRFSDVFRPQQCATLDNFKKLSSAAIDDEKIGYNPQPISAPSSSSSSIPSGWEPGNWDVICQRGKECFEHVGNRRFRMCIENHLQTYIKVESKQKKTLIVSKIVENIQECSARSGGYGFVKKELLSNRWVLVDDKVARDKVGQALRDLIKAAKRRNTRSEFQKSKKQSILKQMDQSNLKETHSHQLEKVNDILQFRHHFHDQDKHDHEPPMKTTQYDETPHIFTNLPYKLEGAPVTKDGYEPRRAVHESPLSLMLDCPCEPLQEQRQVQVIEKSCRRFSININPYHNASILPCRCPSDLTQLGCGTGEGTTIPTVSSTSLMNHHMLDVGCDDTLSPYSLELNTLQNYNQGPATKWRQKSYASRSA